MFTVCNMYVYITSSADTVLLLQKSHAQALQFCFAAPLPHRRLLCSRLSATLGRAHTAPQMTRLVTGHIQCHDQVSWLLLLPLPVLLLLSGCSVVTRCDAVPFGNSIPSPLHS